MRISDWSSDVCSSDLADLELAARQLGLLGPPAGGHVGARLASGRHAVDGAGRAAVDENDALVAAAHLRQVALHDDGLAIEIGEQLQQRAQVLVVGAEVEHTGPSVAEQRLHDDVAVLGAKGLHLRSEEQTSELQSLMRSS